MKHLVLLVLLCLLTGCKVKHHAVVHEEEHTSVVSSDSSDLTSVYQSVSIDSSWFNASTNENYQAHIVVYDTSAPVDESTGKHPVKMEADISSYAASSSCGVSVSQSSDDSSTHAMSSSSAVITHDDIRDEDTESSSNQSVSLNSIVFFVIMAIVGLASFLIKK